MTPQEQNNELRAEIVRLRQLVQLLEQKIDLLVRQKFGAKSEKLDERQLELLLAMEQEAEVKKAEPADGIASASEQRPVRHRNPARRPRLPEDLPVEEEVLIPLAVQAQPEAWREIGQEVREQLDYRPGSYFRRRVVRKKFVSIAQPHQAPIIAPLPPSLQDGCLAAPGLIAHVIVSKFCDHLPLYRQEQRLKWSHDIEVPRQTMMRWLELAVFWMRPIYHYIKTTVMDGDYVQLDETAIRYQEPGWGQCKLGYLWTGAHPQRGVFYHWEPSRAAACLDRIVPVEFTGIIQCDGYAAYPSFARQRELTLAGCWAHVRRKFHEASQAEPRRAGWVLLQIARLYQIEADLRDRGCGPAMRAAVRGAHSRMIVQRLHRALLGWHQGGRLRPQSNFGKALTYTLGLWPSLLHFLDNGQIEIDNNIVENAIRPTAIGKKNWMFTGNKNAGETIAVLYTIVEECRRLQLDPHAYLSMALTRLPAVTNHQVHTLTPAALSPYLPSSKLRAPLVRAS